MVLTPESFLNFRIGTGPLAIINFLTGIFPFNFKHPTAHPLLKKPSLEPLVLNNF